MNKSLVLLFLLAFGSCHHHPTDNYQKKRNQIVDVRTQLKEIKIDNVLLHSYSFVYLCNDYLLICDFKSPDNQLYVFDKNDFHYITGTAPKGEGPGEIANIGHIATDEAHRRIYVSDHGKQKIFSYALDSLATSSAYLPETKMNMNEQEFPSTYQYFNDSIAIGVLIRPTGEYGFNQVSARWNFSRGECFPMPDLHPEIEKKRYALAASLEDSLCVECDRQHDLLTIRTLTGELKYPIYGPQWELNTKKRITYFGQAIFCKHKMIVFYSGKESFRKNRHGDPVAIRPEKLMVFDLDGTYLKTWDVGQPLVNCCYDAPNNRLILSMDGEIQFGYLDLEGLIG